VKDFYPSHGTLASVNDLQTLIKRTFSEGEKLDLPPFKLSQFHQNFLAEVLSCRHLAIAIQHESFGYRPAIKSAVVLHRERAFSLGVL
jgi:hypothetical protein